MAAPLTQLTSTKPPYLWTPDAEAAFIHLKELFSIAPELEQCFPSDRRLTRSFTPALFSLVANYDVGNQELLAIVLTLQEWRHWLEGAALPFLVWTNHRNLTYPCSAKWLNSCQPRWVLFLEHFQYTLTYRPVFRNTEHPQCMVAVARWDIQRSIRVVQCTPPPPNDCPPSRIFVADATVGPFI